MTQVTISEFKKNIKYYSDLVKKEDILVLDNGKPIMRITDPLKNRTERMKQLRGIIKTDTEFEKILEMRQL